jgi:hypothetical protein
MIVLYLNLTPYLRYLICILSCRLKLLSLTGLLRKHMNDVMQVSVVLHLLEFLLEHPGMHSEYVECSLTNNDHYIEEQIKHVPPEFVEKAVKLVKTSMLQRQCFEMDSEVFEVY